MNYDSTKAERVFRDGKCIGVLMPVIREYTTKHIPTSPTVPYLKLVTINGEPT